MKKYQVRFMKDYTYEVIEFRYGDPYEESISEESVFQGSLADCEAYIRLHEGGYM